MITIVEEDCVRIDAREVNHEKGDWLVGEAKHILK